MNESKYQIQSGSWTELASHAKFVRTAVFIQEQNIPEHEEWDEQDASSLHFIVYDQNQPIATARLLKNNSIGRVAVLEPYRGKGIGQILMQQIIQVAKDQKCSQLKLSAQVYATKFYENLGFQSQSEEYLDCEIPHIDMTMFL